MNSYNKFTYILILVTPCSDLSYEVLSLYIYLDGGTYPQTLTSIYLILVQISRRSYRGTLRYYKAYTYTIGLILILRSLHLFGGTSRYYRDITERILILQNLFLSRSTRKYYLLKCPKRHILVLISNLYLIKSTRRYY